MLLADIVLASTEVTATSSRKAKMERLAACLRQLAPDEIVPAVAWMSGELRQRQIGVGWASLRDLPPPADAPTLTIADVDAALETIGAQAGPGSQAARRTLIGNLFGRATAPEQTFLRSLLTGELRQGAQEGVMVDAVAAAAAVPGADVRRAFLLAGDLRAVAAAALARGVAGLGEFHLVVGRPLAPMLAQTAESLEAALTRVCPAAVEWKLDGVRVQVHRDGNDVAAFTRSLDDITHRLPEVVEAARMLPVRSAVLDGEAIALDEAQRPHPFQVTASRVGSKLETDQIRRRVPLSAVFFDVLHADGDDLLDAPGRERYDVLSRIVPPSLLIPRTVADDLEGADRVYRAALDQGHEGVVVKSLDVPYEAGRRGGGWLKVKPRHTLDLVVLAVEWGHGRRQGWLSNLHLGARDPAGGFVMLGKTFKGLTDAMLEWQTRRLLELEVSRNDYTVFVRPELVVEIAFDGVQRSSRYPGGVALRFARVLRYREDKRADQADTIDTILAIRAGHHPR
ncbi:MAG: ATP-dependent DNA ligase [Acidimicrobiales bacterium]